MKTRIVKQYICEYCGKRGLSAGHMGKHERHCTMNPARECRMCTIIERHGDGAHAFSIDELKAFLPEPVEDTRNGMEGSDIYLNTKEINIGIKQLSEAVSHCPACVLAAIRQKGIMVPATRFNYKSEIDDFWGDYNDDIYGGRW
ncbi:MAG: hypothetical protein GY832_47295 [Chloroflexi bacterium]|nr:hypothetical protein [Chloroflexota bacterium]